MSAVELAGAQALSWATAHRAALRALRLNRQFLPIGPLADTVSALAAGGSLRLDADTGLPAPREWSRARVERDLAHETLASLTGDLPEALARKRTYLEALLATEPPPARRIAVALRNQDGRRASYRVVVDRLDGATGIAARYTLLLSDSPGRRISEGELELEVHRTFAERLALLSTQDAALAFAVLRQQGLDVEEVVRGVLGPAVLPGLAGPAALRELSRVAVSAALERASLDLTRGRIDDPLPRPVTVPNDGAGFGLSIVRKWSADAADLPRLKAWLAQRGSRNLVYRYGEP